MTTLSVSEDRHWLAVSDVASAGASRRAAASLGVDAGLSGPRLADLAIVASELATNLARHADDGCLLLRLRRTRDVAGVELLAIDRGPGMADIVESTRDGHSTAGTLGIGLGAIVRKADEFDVYTRAGVGTVMAATLWSKRPATTSWASGVSRPLAGEDACGDAYAAREVEGRRQIMLCDGLGHGQLASVAAQAAVSAFTTAPGLGLVELVRYLHQRLQHTRGAVAGVAELGPDGVSFAGIGNISASIVDGERRRSMVSLPGIVGQQATTIRAFDYRVSPSALVILHSDGLTERWDLAQYPGLYEHAPVIIAGTLLRDAAKRRDDAAVLVARVS